MFLGVKTLQAHPGHKTQEAQRTGLLAAHLACPPSVGHGLPAPSGAAGMSVREGRNSHPAGTPGWRRASQHPPQGHAATSPCTPDTPPERTEQTSNFSKTCTPYWHGGPAESVSLADCSFSTLQPCAALLWHMSHMICTLCIERQQCSTSAVGCACKWPQQNFCGTCAQAHRPLSANTRNYRQ